MFAAAIEKTELEQRIFSSDELSAEDKLLNISSWGFIAFFISAFSEEYFATGLHKASEGTGKKIFSLFVQTTPENACRNVFFNFSQHVFEITIIKESTNTTSKRQSFF